MPYLLDANVLIEAKNRCYGLDFCPAFWGWLLQANGAGSVFSIERVGDELGAGEDELAAWAEVRGSERPSGVRPRCPAPRGGSEGRARHRTARRCSPRPGWARPRTHCPGSYKPSPPPTGRARCVLRGAGSRGIGSSLEAPSSRGPVSVSESRYPMDR